MLRKTIAGALILAALACVGSTVVESLTSAGRIDWLEDVVGAGAFHATCMIVASFLLTRPAGGPSPAAGEPESKGGG
ncbi:MAG: hypothetical protein HY907_06335 [Deltaproteobacteria bacterium]|nr:hypothetical protein [Deltaproteobacteria bacterium]